MAQIYKDRKHPSIDLLKLYTDSNYQKWNDFLSYCLVHQNINRLAGVYYGVQAGMADLAGKGLNSEKIAIWFVRIQKSIEQTAKKILRAKHPHPFDDPANVNTKMDQRQYKEWISAKRKRDAEFQQFLDTSRF